MAVKKPAEKKSVAKKFEGVRVEKKRVTKKSRGEIAEDCPKEKGRRA
jgi:hypothetical protein